MSTSPSHVGQLIARQFVLQELERRLRLEETPPGSTLDQLCEGPWVTVSRQLGSGGAELARRVGERLDWLVYDREILEVISHETHTKEQILARLDGRAVGFIEDYLFHLLVPEDPGQTAYLKEMMQVVTALGHHGRAVLVGRGANWLLGPRFGLRVRIVAPLETRVAALVQAENLSASDARRLVRADDEAQRKFIRQVYRREIDDPLGYDLLLNLGELDAEAAVEIVLAALDHKLTRSA